MAGTVKIKVTHVFPPIPIRMYDYSAIDEDTYDASYEGEDETGHHWKGSPIGWGATEEEAIQDLKDQIKERQEGSANGTLREK